MNDVKQEVSSGLGTLVAVCYGRAVHAGWHMNKDGSNKQMNVGEMIALCHSELSEALEGYRKGLKDDHLTHRSMVMTELADTVIRICHLAGYLNSQGELDRLEDCLLEKLDYNSQRADHKPENRFKEGGKKF